MLKWIHCVCASIALVLDFKAQQRGDAQANGPGSFAMAHQPQRSSGAAFEGQIDSSCVVSGCFWAVCSCLLMLISRFGHSFCWCVFVDIFWHVAMKSICPGLDSQRAGLEVGARSSTASPLKGGTMIPMKSWWAMVGPRIWWEIPPGTFG